MEFIVPILVFSFLAFLDRLKEFTVFDSWNKKIMRFMRVKPNTMWFRWWRGNDEDELTKWYMWHIRDAYHAFKNISVLFLIVLLMFWHWEYIIGVLSWWITQYVMQFLLERQ